MESSSSRMRWSSLSRKGACVSRGLRRPARPGGGLRCLERGEPGDTNALRSGCRRWGGHAVLSPSTHASLLAINNTTTSSGQQHAPGVGGGRSPGAAGEVGL